MSAAAEGDEAPPIAWQPFTFGGVAAFATATFGRVFTAQLIVVVMVASSAVWFLHRAYCPVILQAIQKMPETARLARGTLQGVPETLMADSRFLAVAATPQPGSQIGQDADLQIRLRQNDLCAGSVYWPTWGWEIPYDPGIRLNLSRSNLEPWLGAWEPVLLVGIGTSVAVGLFLIWIVLATVYVAPVKFVALFADRAITWGGAWRLGAASLLAGGVVMTGSIFLYAWNVIDLVGLSLLISAQVLFSWTYLAGGLYKTGRIAPVAAKGNPFIP